MFLAVGALDRAAPTPRSRGEYRTVSVGSDAGNHGP
jgi:hypothetical protein